MKKENINYFWPFLHALHELHGKTGFNLNYLRQADSDRLNIICNELSKMLTNLINKIIPKGVTHE